MQAGIHAGSVSPAGIEETKESTGPGNQRKNARFVRTDYDGPDGPLPSAAWSICSNSSSSEAVGPLTGPAGGMV